MNCCSAPTTSTPRGTSSNAWLQINQGTSLKAGYVVTAAAIAPSNSLVLYAAVYNQSKGTSAVFVTQNNGADGFPEEDSGLPTGTAGAVATGFAVDPTNPLIAFVTFGGLGNYSHVYMTANGGKSWTSIQGNLPNVPAYSFVTDPRQQAAAGAPNGHLYIGTEVVPSCRSTAAPPGRRWARDCPTCRSSR